MKLFTKFTIAFSVFSLFAFVLPGKALAAIDPTTIAVKDSIGTVTDIWGIFVFIVGVMQAIGWAGVIVGIVIILALLIYRLISTDDAEAMKTVQEGITKAVLIVIVGLLLISAGFIIKTVGGLFGLDEGTDLSGSDSFVPDVLRGS